MVFLLTYDVVIKVTKPGNAKKTRKNFKGKQLLISKIVFLV